MKPFTDVTGIAIDTRPGPVAVSELSARKEGTPDAVDIVALNGDTLASACDEGLLEKLDWTQIGGRDHYLPQAISDCGVGSALYAFVLAWDRDKFQGAPSWADFWDVTKYPGKRGLKHDPETNLEFALLADGVAPGDIYRTLRTADGVDRAFRKLDQLRPYLVWWEASADAAKILGSGEVLMTSAANPTIVAANHATGRNFGMQWAASLSKLESWGVVKGSANLRQAYQLLYVVGSSAIQARLTAEGGYGGLAKGANDGLPPPILASSPTAPANLSAALPIDEQFWRENREKLSQRFEQWLSK
ncbi:MAG: extracellular solute-binding protein [Acetobacteraceae bacterium]|nr:extracellular solute-binding protein [Acetobacteraceae bacterium]